MDVRFYPSAAGGSLPGDPSNLDFAQCLGYYNYNKVINPALGRSSGWDGGAGGSVEAPEPRSRLPGGRSARPGAEQWAFGCAAPGRAQLFALRLRGSGRAPRGGKGRRRRCSSARCRLRACGTGASGR